jgi:hypothetical protein
MGSLVQAVQDTQKRPLIIQDCSQLIEDQVRSKRGMTGIAVKGAFKVIKSFKPGIIPRALDDMLDEFSGKVDPFWLASQKEGADPASYFRSNSTVISNALLSITDERAKNSPNRGLVKAYSSLRKKAVGHITEALPSLGELIAKHAS